MQIYLTPKGVGSFTLASKTIRSHWVDLISPIVPFFAVVLYNETWLPILNLHISYKTPSSCRILFWYGGYLRQFSCLKKFRARVVPNGGCRKRIIIQGRQLNRMFYCGRPVMPENKRGCNGSFCLCAHTEE